MRKDPSPAIILSGSVKADVVIVGGGMMGLSAAYALHKQGLKPIIVERDFCGAGASGKTSGFITPDSEIELSSLLATYGPEKAKRIWEFVLSGVSAIRATIEHYAIDCDYQVQDSLFVANNKTATKHIAEEHAARHALDYQSRQYDGMQIREIIGSSSYAGGVRYPNTFGMNSYLYCQALRDNLMQAGVRIYEKTPVLRIQTGGVDTSVGNALAPHVIVCADRFIPDLGIMKKEIYHVQTFLGISKPLRDADMQKIFPRDRMMVWDTDLVYNYFRAAGENRILLGGGDVLYTYAHSISNNTARFKKRLAFYFRKKFPNVPLELEYIWPGMLGVSKDLLPVMGDDLTLNNVWYAGAATGLPWAAALGAYAADRIVHGRNEFDKDFSWQRKFIIGPRLQMLLTTPAAYALSHGIAKYF